MKITCDLHAHTHLSVCGQDCATIERYVETALDFGLTTIGIADHMWDAAIPYTPEMRVSRSAGEAGEAVVNWYKIQDMAHCRRILPEIAATDTKGVRFLFGGEVDYAKGRGAAISEREAETLDFIIVPNSHTHHVMDKSWYEPYEKHAEFMLRATMDICTGPTRQYVTSLAHPFDAVCCPYPLWNIIDTISDAQFREVFCAAKENGIAAEINGSSFRDMTAEEIPQSAMFRVLTAARNCGCKFTFGSDSHVGDGRKELRQAALAADLLGLTDNDILVVGGETAAGSTRNAPPLCGGR